MAFNLYRRNNLEKKVNDKSIMRERRTYIKISHFRRVIKNRTE